MKQLPLPPSPNERVLAQEYREVFTGITGPTVALTYTPVRTVDKVGLELVFRNGVLLDSAAPGASAVMRESFTGITDPSFTLTNRPVIGSELVFRNGSLIDDRADRTAPLTIEKQRVERFTGSSSVDITLAHEAVADTTLVAKNGAVLDPDTDYSVTDDTLTLDSRSSGDVIVVRYSYHDTLPSVVDPASGTYAIDEDGMITPSIPPDVADVFTVWYEYGGASGGGDAGYSIDGNVLTLATDLTESDHLVVHYPYRNN